MIARRWLGISLIVCAVLLATREPLLAQTCSFSAAVGINFGNYNVLSFVAVRANGSLKYSCVGFVSGSDSVTVTLNKGNAPTYNPRFMLHAGTPLNYNIYTDAARTKIFGDGSPGTFIYGPFTAPNGVVETVTLFGLLPARQNVTVGVYTDTITATINY